ncbi:MAG: RHS repeat-associated core domain-containing protein, partial [Ktedonobacteraceae bacterium]
MIGVIFLLTDALGSVVAAFSNTKGAAALSDNQVYDPYGNLLYSANGTMGTTKGYTGQYSDPLTGLDYYVSRYYDPVAGVFLSADTKEGNAPGMNLYARGLSSHFCKVEKRMQHSSIMQFCDECGLANDLAATHCVSCLHPLAHKPHTITMPVASITITPSSELEVIPGNVFTAVDTQSGNILADRYRVWKEIGYGGFSTVYWGRERVKDHRKVAIKRIQLSALTPRQIIDATET